MEAQIIRTLCYLGVFYDPIGELLLLKRLKKGYDTHFTPIALH